MSRWPDLGILRGVGKAEPEFLIESFLARWSNAAASERANAQLLLAELTDLLGAPRAGNDHAAGYSFEVRVRIPVGHDSATDGRIST